MKNFLYRVVVLLSFLPLYGTAQVGFNKIGFVENIPNNSFEYSSVALQPDGKIVAVGQTDDQNDNTNGLIARFNIDGTLDNTFGTNGVIDNIPNNSFAYYSVALQADGKIVAVGQTDDNNGLIARFNADGSLDQDFGDNGVITDVPNNHSAYYSVALQRDGKIIAVGTTDDNNGLIARFNADGELDQTFNGTGVITNVPNNCLNYNSVVVQADGKIVAVGETNDENGLIARFNADGELDQTFNGTGVITNVPNNSSRYDSVALQPDGKIIAVGSTDDDNGLIARFNTDGTLDTTFNRVGFIDNVPNNSWAYRSVALQPDGKIVAVGTTDDDDGLIARFLSNGVLDAESNWNLKNFRESKNINNVSIGLLG